MSERYLSSRKCPTHSRMSSCRHSEDCTHKEGDHSNDCHHHSKQHFGCMPLNADRCFSDDLEMKTCLSRDYDDVVKEAISLGVRPNYTFDKEEACRNIMYRKEDSILSRNKELPIICDYNRKYPVPGLSSRKGKMVGYPMPPWIRRIIEKYKKSVIQNLARLYSLEPDDSNDVTVTNVYDQCNKSSISSLNKLISKYKPYNSQLENVSSSFDRTKECRRVIDTQLEDLDRYGDEEMPYPTEQVLKGNWKDDEHFRKKYSEMDDRFKGNIRI